jgi:ABC-type sugar transport system permease subunit
VILPLLKPAVLFALVLTGISGFIVFGQVLIMTAGGPGRASEVLALYLYRFGFEYLDMGRAAAVGVVIFCLILALTVGAFRWLGYGGAL